MRIEELKNFGVGDEYIEKFKKEKIFELYPYQASVLKRNILSKNFVLSIPTAAGKTFVATLAILKKLEKGKKAVYVVPLVALAVEKYEYYKKLFDKYRVAISVGDYDSADPWLAEYDLIICTTEKLDSLIRHGAKWIEDVSLIVIDEIHLLNDSSRGPTLEILIARLKKIIPKAQLIALSATIKNCKELAEWLDAELIESDFRPVKLYEGVAYDSKIKIFENGKIYEISNLLELEASIVDQTLRFKKQALIFVSTRRKSQSLAKKLSKIVKNWLSKSDSDLLKKVSNEIENVLEVPTKQCKELASCIKCGVAFHHAGLLSKQKRLIEENFRKGLIKVIVATPTLAYGVNLPAFRVIIKDAKRYYPGIGSIYIPVLEYKQFVGRAGRPQYDKYGEAILIARSEEEAFELAEKFIFGELEEIRSKLGYEPLLRMHTLALIASNFVKEIKDLLGFFKKTFFYFQYGDLSYIESKLLEILEELKEWNFVLIEKEKLKATKIGKRVSELYIDPLTAKKFIDGLENAEKKVEEISFLQLICSAIEMKPLLKVRIGESREMENYVIKNEECFLQKVPDEWDVDYDEFLKTIKTARMFEAWINEKTEDEILTEFRVAPGELRARLEIADWLLYSLHELALLLGKKELLRKIKKLRARMIYGVKEELLKLVKLEGVGRIRARKLFNAGLKTYKDLRKIPIESLAKLIGERTALKIKEQLTKKVSKKEVQQTLVNS